MAPSARHAPVSDGQISSYRRVRVRSSSMSALVRRRRNQEPVQQGELFPKCSDVGGNISRLISAEGKIRHLRMWIEKKKRDFFRRKIWLACDHSKRRNVGACLFLIAGNHVAARAPTLRELFAMVRISRHRSSSERQKGRNQERASGSHAPFLVIGNQRRELCSGSAGWRDHESSDGTVD
jgi:hypothetical protein